MFSCEYCEVFKSTYFEEYLRTTASKCSFYFTWLETPFACFVPHVCHETNIDIKETEDVEVCDLKKQKLQCIFLEHTEAEPFPDALHKSCPKF